MRQEAGPAMTSHGSAKFSSSLVALVATIAIAVCSTSVRADNLSLSFYGRFVSATGEPVQGPVEVQVKFFRSATGADEVAVPPLTFSAVTLDDGVFQLPIAMSDADLN